MTEDNKAFVESAVKELRTTIEASVKSELDALDKNKIQKINAELDKIEQANQKLVKELSERSLSEQDLKDRMIDLETKMSRPSNGVADEKAMLQAEWKKLEQVFVNGDKGLSREEIKALRTDNNIDGGYLVRPEFDRELIKKLSELSAVRPFARVRTIGAKRMEYAKRDTLLSVAWAGEGAALTESTSDYGQGAIVPKKLTIMAEITSEALQDSEFNLESLVNEDVAEAFAVAEGTAFVKGAVPTQPIGFMTGSQIPEYNLGNASSLTMDGIIKLAGQIKSSGYGSANGYLGNARYFMNRKTASEVRTLKDSMGQYYWVAGNIAAGVPNTLNGYQYVEFPDLDDVAANAFPIVFGDLSKAYTIVDRIGLSFIRDPYTLAKDDKVRYTFTRRVGGDVVLAEALVKGKISV